MFILNVDNLYHIIKVNILKEIEQIANNFLDITLIIPLLKENKMDLILQKTTELGVNKIIPVIMEGSIIKLEETKQLKKIERRNKICKEASEQSKRLDYRLLLLF